MDTHTDTQTRVTTIHFASSTTHEKCNNLTFFSSLHKVWQRRCTRSPFETNLYCFNSTDNFRVALCPSHHSNATRAPIANPPSSAQLGGSLYHTLKLHRGPCSSVDVRPQTDRQTDRHTYTDRLAWPQYILRRLRLMQNVKRKLIDHKVHWFHIFHCGRHVAVNHCDLDTKDLLHWCHFEFCKQWCHLYGFVDITLFTMENRTLLRF